MPAFSNDPPSIALGDVRTSAIDDIQLYIAQINTSATPTDYETYAKDLWYALVNRSHALPGMATSEDWQWWWQARRKCYQRMGMPWHVPDVTWEMATRDAVWRGPSNGTSVGSNGQSGNDWLGAANFSALLADNLPGFTMWNFGGTVRVWQNDGVTGFFDQAIAQPRPVMGSGGGTLEAATPTWDRNTWRLNGPRIRSLRGQQSEDFRRRPFMVGMEAKRVEPVVVDKLNGAAFTGPWPPSTQPTGLYLDKQGIVRLAPAGTEQWVLGQEPNQFTFYGRDTKTLYRYDGGGWILDEVRNLSEDEAEAYSAQWLMTQHYSGRMRSLAQDAATYAIRDDFSNKPQYAYIQNHWPAQYGPQYKTHAAMGGERTYGRIRSAANAGQVWDCDAARRGTPSTNNQYRDFDLIHLDMPSQWGRFRVRFLDLPSWLNPADPSPTQGLVWVDSKPVPLPQDFMRKCYPALRIEGWVPDTKWPDAPYTHPFWYLDIPVGYIPVNGYMFDSMLGTTAIHDSVNFAYNAGRTEIVGGQNYEIAWFDQGNGNVRFLVRQFAGAIDNIINPVFTAVLMDRQVPIPTSSIQHFGINVGHGAWQTEHYRPSGSTAGWRTLNPQELDASIEEIWLKAD